MLPGAWYLVYTGFVSYTKSEQADAAITHMNGYFIGQKRLKVVRKRGQHAERCPPPDTTLHTTLHTIGGGGGGGGGDPSTTNDPSYAPISDSSVLGGMMGRPGRPSATNDRGYAPVSDNRVLGGMMGRGPGNADIEIELAQDNFGSDVIGNKGCDGGGDGGGDGGDGGGSGVGGGGLQLELDFLTPESLLGQSMARRVRQSRFAFGVHFHCKTGTIDGLGNGLFLFV